MGGTTICCKFRFLKGKMKYLNTNIVGRCNYIEFHARKLSTTERERHGYVNI